AGEHEPIAVVVVQCPRNKRRVGERRIAHPEPHPAILFDRRVAAHYRCRRNDLLLWNLDTLSRRCKLQPVVHAPQIIALSAPARQWRQAMTAAILQRHDTSITLAVEHDRLTQYCARHKRVGGKMVAPARDIPTVAQKHISLPILSSND